MRFLNFDLGGPTSGVTIVFSSGVG